MVVEGEEFIAIEPLILVSLSSRAEVRSVMVRVASAAGECRKPTVDEGLGFRIYIKKEYCIIYIIHNSEND